MRLALIIALFLTAGCSSFDISRPFAQGATRTFNASIARVKPAFVTSLVQMGMSISSIETRGGLEVLKAKRSGSSVEVEFERLGPASTRVRVATYAGSTYDAAGASKVIQQTEKLLGGA